MKDFCPDIETSRTWCELSKSAFRHNLKQLKKFLPQKSGLMAVIKANAYGHGAVWCAKEALAHGCSYLAVATIEEAIELRKADISAPILLLSPYHQGFAPTLLEFNITQTIGSDYEVLTLLRDLSETIDAEREASTMFQNYTESQTSLKIHIKIDTGMNRIGFSDRIEDVVNLVNSIEKLKANSMIDPEGIFTHFAVADEPENPFTKIQFERFTRILKQLEAKNILFKIKHCSNSLAAISFPEVALDYVRLGISLYGWCPNLEIKNKLNLKPVMSFFSRISSIHKTVAEDSVGYGMTYKTDKETVIGTMEAGYADGMNRHLSNKGTVLINGKNVPIIGRVCMDRTMLDLTNIPTPKVGDKVLIFGKDILGNYRDLDLLADQAGTISYEIVCQISERVPKIFVD